jgi:hypothetical protein
VWLAARDGSAVVDSDPWLEPQRPQLRERFGVYRDALATLEAQPGGLDGFSRSYERFGYEEHATLSAVRGHPALSAVNDRIRSAISGSALRRPARTIHQAATGQPGVCHADHRNQVHRRQRRLWRFPPRLRSLSRNQ